MIIKKPNKFTNKNVFTFIKALILDKNLGKNQKIGIIIN